MAALSIPPAVSTALEVSRRCQSSSLLDWFACLVNRGTIVGRVLSTPDGPIEQFSLPLTDGLCQRWQPCALSANPFGPSFTNASFLGPSQPQDPRTYLAQILASPLTLPGGAPFAEGSLQVTLLLPVKTAAEIAAGVVFDVVIWTHGGGFAEGSVAVNYEMAQATKQRYNVVALEYRLGILGFMPMLVVGQPRRPQNLGLLDSYLGEQWVRSYLRYFDAVGRVTHKGQSAGATTVSLLPMLRDWTSTASPLVPRLVDGGIALSDYMSVGIRSATALPLGATELPHVQLARAVGCLAAGVLPSPGSTTLITPETEACMLTKTWQQLFATPLGTFVFTEFSPVVDGVTITLDVAQFARLVVANPNGPEARQWRAAGGPYQFWGNHGPIEGLLLEVAAVGDYGILGGEASYADFVAEAASLFQYWPMSDQLAARAFYGDRPAGTPCAFPGCWAPLAQSANWYVPMTQMAGTFAIVANTVTASYAYGLLPGSFSMLTAFIWPTTRMPFGSHSSDLDYFQCSTAPLETPALSPIEIAFCAAVGALEKAFMAGNVNSAARIGAPAAAEFYPDELAGTRVQQFDMTLQTVYVLGAASTPGAYHAAGCDQVTPIAAGAASFTCLQRASGTDLAYVAALHNGTAIAQALLF